MMLSRQVLRRSLTLVQLGSLAAALAGASAAGSYFVPPGDIPLQWSSDGNRIAVVRVAVGTSLPKQLIIVNLKTKLSEELVKLWTTNMALSPDLEWLAVGGGPELVVMRPDGTDRRVLVAGLHPYAVPSWNVDGERIAFEILTRNGASVFTVRRDGTELREVASGGARPAWSPDGSRIAFWCDGHICLVDAYGSARTELTPTLREHAEAPVWSPTGTAIAFTTGEGSVGVVGLDGRLSLVPGTAYGRPSWSPEGRLVAYGSDDGVRLLDVAKRTSRRISNLIGGDFYEGSPVVSPDGRSVAFSGAGECRLVSVYVHRLDATTSSLITNECRRYGTPGRDVIVGEGYGLVAYGFGGDDLLVAKGYGGDLYGGLGNDELRGVFDGNDVLDGGSGRDRISGGFGHDRIRGGSGRDRIGGGGGRDQVDSFDRERDAVACGTNLTESNVERDVAYVDRQDGVASDCEAVYRLPEAGRAGLRITVWPGGAASTPASWTLRCVPTGGTLPHAAEACARLARLDRPFQPAPCASGKPSSPHIAWFRGRFRGRPVNFTLRRTGASSTDFAQTQHLRDDCVHRWDELAPLLPVPL